MTLHTTPATIAAALRRAADDIAAMGDVDLDPSNVHLSIQVANYEGTPRTRKTAVDALGIALTGYAGESEVDGSRHHRTPYKAIFRRGDVDVSVFTALTDANHHPTRHVCQDTDLTEVRVSDCEAGCKVWTCSGCDVDRVVHSATYGCTKAGA